MVNVKIYGMDNVSGEELRRKIHIMLRQKGYGEKDSTTTVIQSECRTVGLKEWSSPYLEIVVTQEKDFDRIVAGLKDLRVRLPVQRTYIGESGFIPARKME